MEYTKPKPIRECLDDPVVKEVLEKIASGELVPSTGPEEVVWTEEDKKRLNEALAKCFGWKEDKSA